jgi:hypothetical protein
MDQHTTMARNITASLLQNHSATELIPVINKVGQLLAIAENGSKSPPGQLKKPAHCVRSNTRIAKKPKKFDSFRAVLRYHTKRFELISK